MGRARCAATEKKTRDRDIANAIDVLVRETDLHMYMCMCMCKHVCMMYP